MYLGLVKSSYTGEMLSKVKLSKYLSVRLAETSLYYHYGEP